MLIIKLWNYLRGYIEFRLEGLNLERVLNMAISRDVYLWDIKRIDYTTIEAKVGIKGYDEILMILNKTGCRGKINMKIGWPFFISRFKERKMIIIGFFISLFSIIVITSFIWTIDINCSNYILEKDIYKFLETNGVNKGILKYDINISEIKDSLLIQYDRIAWVGVEIKGTKLTIDIIEKEEKIKDINNSVPCDIVATKTGIVEKVIAKDGDAVVKKGDIVKPNQVLISGTIERNGSILRYVHSMGKVYARTYYEEKYSMPLEKIVKEKTGNIFVRRIIKIGNTSITIGSNNVPFNKYILNKENKKFAGWRNIRFPVEFLIEQYNEIIEKKISISEEEIKKSLQDKLMVTLIPQISKDAEILSKNFDFSKDNNNIIGTLTIEAIESIGKEKIIVVPKDLDEFEEQ